MTIALFSDIHANLPALEAVLADLDARRPDMVFCLGDLVGYAPWPNEVVAAIRSRAIPVIAGNYDEGVGRASDDCGCAYRTDEEQARGARSIAFTNERVTAETRAYLRTLPRQIRLTLELRADQPIELVLVHGSPRRINEYLFEDRPENSLRRMMRDANADVLCFGHTHMPYYKCIQPEDEGDRVRHAVNTGSVGKPKDGDARTGYVLLHVRAERADGSDNWFDVEFVRLEYDVARAAAAIRASDLPDEYAEMLIRGS